ncbi:unnamed protein product [Prorocentrum cordatum]|uniref:Uncharacterized protein n=1 Tax=Prorocentrum cordatum TaxID=2364126 RepID=A0ABN9PD59_9DINO|nr:unnamed protein product [Polarella glacialis]
MSEASPRTAPAQAAARAAATGAAGSAQPDERRKGLPTFLAVKRRPRSESGAAGPVDPAGVGPGAAAADAPAAVEAAAAEPPGAGEPAPIGGLGAYDSSSE